MYTVVHSSWGIICFCFFCQLVSCEAQHSPQADVIKHCVKSTNSTACCLTYEHVYKNLIKSENSFNISYALYPEGAKPSFLVRVNVYGPNKTHCSTPAMFTWSMHCLYANVPAWLLQILSLGSIFVTSRSQELNIQIPEFCCNISDDQKEREKIISGFLKRAQYELQDLAVSPGIRDPSLNTAECVIQGHKPDFETSGRSCHIRAMLWLSMIFVIVSAPLLAKYIRDLEELINSNYEKKNTLEATCFSFYLFSVPTIVLVFAAFLLSCVCWSKGSTFDMTVVLLVMISSSLIEYCCITKWCTYTNSKWKCLLKICGGHAISYIVCWLIIGIRINITWGLTIVLLVISFFATVTYAKYLYLKEIASPNGSNSGAINITSSSNVDDGADTTTNSTSGNNTDGIQAKVICAAGCFAVLLLFIIVILAGHSNTGKEMNVDEVLKATSLYFITAFISWATWKKPAASDQLIQNNRPAFGGSSPVSVPIPSRRGQQQQPEAMNLIK